MKAGQGHSWLGCLTLMRSFDCWTCLDSRSSKREIGRDVCGAIRVNALSAVLGAFFKIRGGKGLNWLSMVD